MYIFYNHKFPCVSNMNTIIQMVNIVSTVAVIILYNIYCIFIYHTVQGNVDTYT